MKYIVGLDRYGEPGDPQGVPAHIEVRDTNSQGTIEEQYTMPSQLDTNPTKEYTPTGILSSVSEVVYVGTKTGLVRFKQGQLFPFSVDPSRALDSLISQRAKEVVPNDGTCSSALAVVDNIVYWLPTIKRGNRRDQKSVGLFHVTAKGLEELAFAANIPVVGPLLGFEDHLFFYVEKDRSRRRGMFYSSGQHDFHKARDKKDPFSEKLYPQPVALCTDGTDVYAAGSQGTETVISQFSQQLELKQQVRFPSLHDATAFTVFKANYIPEFSCGTRQPEPMTYALVGGMEGNLTLVAMDIGTIVAQFNILDDAFKTHLQPQPYVRKLFTSKRADGEKVDADIVVQYTDATVHVTAYDLLLGVAIMQKGGYKGVFPLQEYTANFRDNSRIAVFSTPITCCEVL